jgi:Zn-dependent peptidase ImmA (M78 family)
MNKSDLLIKKNVASFRETAGLNQTEPVRLHELLLKLKVLTVFKPLSVSFSGMALKVGDKRFILINSNQPIGRQNFTIGHELFHLFEQEDFHPHSCQTGFFNKSNYDEYRADIFSANLLIPEDGLLNLISEQELQKDKIQLKTLLKAEQYFEVSHLALLHRLRNLDIISKEYLEENKADVIKKAEKLRFDTKIYKPGNDNLILGDYTLEIKELFEKGKISEGHFNELLNALSNG